MSSTELKNIDAGVFVNHIQNSPIPTFIINTDHIITHWNYACEQISNVSAPEMIGTKDGGRVFYGEDRPLMADLILDDRIDDLKKYYTGKYRSNAIREDVWEALDFFPHLPDGGKWLVISAQLLKNQKGEVIGVIEVLCDVTEQKRTERRFQDNQNLLSQIIDGSPVPMFVLDEDHKVTHWNKACESVVGTKAKDVIGTTNQWQGFYDQERPVMADLILSGEEEGLHDYYNNIWSKSEIINGAWHATDYFPHFGDGGRWLSFTAAPIYGDEGMIVGAVETLQDISGQKAYENQLMHQANHDTLTGLANRTLLYERFKDAVSCVTRDNKMLSVLFIDLDNFKTINDTLGHTAGDQLICEAAESISQCVRPMDTVARLGGDEFIVLLLTPDSVEHTLHVVQRISKALEKNYFVEKREVYVSSSIGIAMYPENGKDLGSLMMNADSAMYQAKKENKGGFRFFTSDMNKQANFRLEIENDLRKAIEEQQFELFYQPVFDLETKQVAAAEALIRWNHPTKGIISPDEFIQIAEETNMIVDIGDWVMETALRECLYWQEKLHTNIRISINVSARQFQNNKLFAVLRRMCKEITFSKLDVELELTENVVMQHPDQAQKNLMALNKLNIKLAMDDFGTGYSSLAYLTRFPFDRIKIDKAFIGGLGKTVEAEAIVHTICELGRAMGMGILAEGVETEEQCAFLEKEYCGEVQGYYFSRPMDTSAFRGMLANQHRHMAIQGYAS